MISSENLFRIVREYRGSLGSVGILRKGSIRLLHERRTPPVDFIRALLRRELEADLANLFSAQSPDARPHEIDGPFGLRFRYAALDRVAGGVCGFFIVAAHDPPSSVPAATSRLRKKRIKQQLAAAHPWEHPQREDLADLVRAAKEHISNAIREYNESAFEQTVTTYKDFVSSFSHEVLSPIQELRTSIEFAANKCEPDSDISGRLTSGLDAIDSLRVSLEGMRILFRDGSRLPLDNQFRATNVRTVVERWCQLYDGQFKAKNIEVILEPSSSTWVLRCVPEYIEVMVKNLISNGVKYSFDASSRRYSGKFLVRFEESPPSLSVISFGVPIGQDEIDSGRLFAMESRGISATDRGRVGKGVGLFLVKRIVDLHEATIEVRSQIQNPLGNNEFARTEFRIIFQ